MPGPGGGPPRKSHTKSRKGCKTCKKRHIRCDEQYPQCRNCIKHGTMCDYVNSPPPSDEMPRASSSSAPAGPNLKWTPGNEAEVDRWLSSGIFPFPELGLRAPQQLRVLSRNEARLVHHLCSIHRDMQRKGQLQCVAWLEKLPFFLEAAVGFDFVMSAVLAFSATNLANETNSNETRSLAYHHYGTALNGLHSALGSFSQQTSDAILAASVLLSWQASDWTGWNSLMGGISTILSSMSEWRHSSNLASFVESHVQFHPPSFVQQSFNPMLAGAPLMDADDQSLQDSIQSLEHLSRIVRRDPYLCQIVEELMGACRAVQNASATMREEHLYDVLRSLRTRLLWLPISILSNNLTNLHMVVLAHVYAAGLAIDASIPELNGAALGALNTASIDEIDRRVRFSPPARESVPLEDLMEFPRIISSRVRYSRSSIGSMSHQHNRQHSHSGSQSPYGFQNLQLDSAPTTPNFAPTIPTWFSHSMEDLSGPPSPFLQPFAPHINRRHSGLVDSSPLSMPYDRRSFQGFTLSQRADSVGSYSPSFSPALLFDEDPSISYNESASSAVYTPHSGFVNPAVWV